MEDLWNEAYELMHWRHILWGHDLIDSVNRLLVKNPWVKDCGVAFQIPRERLTIRAEQWPLERLWKLVHPSQITDVEPDRPTGAILVLRWREADYLMDGRRRINLWHRRGTVGPHRVLLIDEQANDV